MATSKVEYLGNLRTKCTHFGSGTEIITDAPLDNNGKAETFSPTDLVATAYASCMMTIIGIYCQSNTINFDKATAEVTKIMGSNPRRISGVEIYLDLSENGWDEIQQEKIRVAGEACPVAKSVHDGIDITINYHF